MMAMLLVSDFIVLIDYFPFFEEIFRNAYIPSSHRTMPFFETQKCFPVYFDDLIQNEIVSKYDNYHILTNLFLRPGSIRIIESIKHSCDSS